MNHSKKKILLCASMQGSLLRPDLSKELQHETRLAPGWPQPHEYPMIESSPLPRVFPNSIQLDINSPESCESREKPEYREKPEHLVKADCDEKVHMRPHTPYVSAYFFSSHIDCNYVLQLCIIRTQIPV